CREQLRERAFVPARRMDDDAGGLVDDEQVLVGVGDLEAAAHERSWRACSIASNSASTPSVIEASARLNGGQPSGSLTKSVTEPTRIRSTTLPRAPPISIPVGSQIIGSRLCRAK